MFVPAQAIFSSKPMERLVIDFTELPECAITRCRWILVIVDHFTSYVWTETFPTKETVPVAMKLLAIVTNHGPCELLSSDNGKEFVSGCIAVRAAHELIWIQISGVKTGGRSEFHMSSYGFRFRGSKRGVEEQSI